MFGWILLVGAELYEAVGLIKKLRLQAESTLLVTENDASILDQSALDDTSVSFGEDEWLDREPYELVIAKEEELGRLSHPIKNKLDRLLPGGSALIAT